MKIKLAVFVLAGWFVAAIVLSGQGGASSSGGASKTKGRVIAVLAVTPEHRLVKHSLGQTEVPLQPRRIVSLSAFVTDSLVAMGISPVGVEGSSAVGEAGKVAPHLADRLSGAKVVSHGGTINLEAVAELKPDLILTSGTENSRWYPYVSRIAPTVYLALDAFSVPRESAVLDIGDALGQAEQARKVVAAHRKKIAQAKRTLAERIGSRPVAFLRFRRQTCVIYTRNQVTGPLLYEKLGLVPDPMVPEGPAPGGWDVLSLERLSRLQAEFLVVTVDRDSEFYWNKLITSPIWKAIPAARQGQVCRVSRTSWTGQGILASEAMIDEMLAATESKRSL